MSHLDIDTIIEYVMINEINDETKALASKVCGHIKECEECRNLVDAYQCVYDGLVEEAVNRQILSEKLKKLVNERMSAREEQIEYYAPQL